MRRTIIIVEHPDVEDEPWIPGFMTEALVRVLSLLQTGKAGCTAYERHASEDGTMVTLLTDTRSVNDDIRYDSLVQIPYSEENASEMFLDKDGR